MKRQHDKNFTDVPLKVVEGNEDFTDVPFEVVEVNSERFKVDVTPLGKNEGPTLRKPTTKEQLARVPAVTQLPLCEDGC